MVRIHRNNRFCESRNEFGQNGIRKMYRNRDGVGDCDGGKIQDAQIGVIRNL